jgi:hypothetical protein
MGDSVMLGEVIGMICITRFPTNNELFFNEVTEPIVPHVHRFENFLFNSIVHEAMGTVVVCLYRCS